MSKKKKVITRDERKTLALVTGIKLAKKHGVTNVTLASVAKEHKITGPLLFHIFGTAKDFHAALRRHAKKEGVTLTEGGLGVAKKEGVKPALPILKAHKGAKPIGVVKKITKTKVVIKLHNAKKIAAATKKAAKAIKAIPAPVVSVVKRKPPKVTVKFPPIPSPPLPLIEGVPGTAGLE